MTDRNTSQTRTTGSGTLFHSAVVGAGGAATAKATGLLSIGKGVAAGIGVGTLAISSLGASIAVGAVLALIYGANATRPARS